MLVPWNSLNRRNVTTSKCAKGFEKKIRWLEEEEMRENAERDFQAYGKRLETATLFKYLGRVLTAADEKFPALVGNLWKSQNSWAQLERILGWEGDSPRVPGIFPKAAAEAVLLFGSETWLMTPCMVRALGIFQHRVSKRITGIHPELQYVAARW